MDLELTGSVICKYVLILGAWHLNELHCYSFTKEKIPKNRPYLKCKNQSPSPTPGDKEGLTLESPHCISCSGCDGNSYTKSGGRLHQAEQVIKG